MIAIVIFGLMAFGAFGIWAILSTERKRKKAEANAPALLDDLFNGEETVSVTLNFTTMKFDTVVVGAKERGYRLIGQASNQYGPSSAVFEKI